MTAITEKITQDQTVQLSKFWDDLVRKLDLSKDEAQQLISNYHLVKADTEKVFRKYAIKDQRFGPAIREFKITVPADYNHDTQINSSAKKAKKEKTTYYYNDALNSKNFAKATQKLQPGKTYTVKIFPILNTVSSEDCLNFLRTQRVILTGGQGATLVYDLAKEQFPKGKWTVSFDEKEALWKDSDGDHRVPRVHAYSDGDFNFSLGYFEYEWRSDDCLLGFCDEHLDA